MAFRNTPSTATDTTTASSWLDALIAETPRLDTTGVSAALVSLHLADEASGRDAQLLKLTKHLLTSTDAAASIGTGRVSLLLTPIGEIAELSARIVDLDDRLAKNGLADAAIGFAIRRPQESLLDTWARADAQADRAAFRREHGADGLVLPDA